MDGSKILVKIKLHLLKHLPQQIRRFGPAVRFSTEVFECFNAVFRMSSVLSNHQAPSRDIALKNADLDRVKHLLSGGYWLTNHGEWVCSGSDTVALLLQTPVLQRHLGWVSLEQPDPGTIRCPGRERQQHYVYRQTQAFQANCQRVAGLSNDSEWTVGIQTIAVSGDRCFPGSWVIIQAASMVSFRVFLGVQHVEPL